MTLASAAVSASACSGIERHGGNIEKRNGIISGMRQRISVISVMSRQTSAAKRQSVANTSAWRENHRNGSVAGISEQQWRKAARQRSSQKKK